MRPEAEQKELLLLLAAACADAGEEDVSRRIREQRDKSTEARVAALSELERQKGLPMSVWTLIVKYKGWLGQKLEREDFMRACWEVQGLI